MIKAQIVFTFVFIFKVNAFTARHILEQYTRPITILYISENPKWLNVHEDDVIIYWTQNKRFLEEVIKAKPTNCLIVTGNESTKKHKFLSEAEHIDIAIIECAKDKESIYIEWHYAEHTFMNGSYTCEPKNNFLKHRPIISFKYPHGGVSVRSSFQRKELIKKSGVTPYLPGLSYHRFLMLLGLYPNVKPLTSQIYDLYDHLKVTDFRVDNTILQGANMKIIDYDPKKNNETGITQTKVIEKYLLRKRELEIYARFT